MTITVEIPDSNYVKIETVPYNEDPKIFHWGHCYNSCNQLQNGKIASLAVLAILSGIGASFFTYKAVVLSPDDINKGAYALGASCLIFVAGLGVCLMANLCCNPIEEGYRSID